MPYKSLRAIEHVELIEPFVWLGGTALRDGKTEGAIAASTSTGATFLKSRLLAGRPFDPQDGATAIVNEFLLYRLGLTGDDAASEAIGRTINFTYTVGQNEQFDLVGIMSFGPNSLSKKETQVLESALKRLAGLVQILPIPTEERQALRRVFDRLTTTTPTSNMKYSQDFTDCRRDP